jgi:hypothetical protein
VPYRRVFDQYRRVFDQYFAQTKGAVRMRRVPLEVVKEMEVTIPRHDTVTIPLMRV